MTDYYVLLGIESNANDIEIRKAYNKKIAEYKEKRKNGENVELKKLIKAYEVLLDKKEREYYDECLEEYYERLMNRTEFDEIVDKIKKDYHDIKRKEERNSFKIRHKRSSEYLEKEYGQDLEPYNKFLFKTSKGVLHVAGEFVYQLNKLIPRKKDDVSRYVLRNRKIILGIIIGGTVITGFNIHEANKEKTSSRPSIETSIAKPIKYVTLNKMYTVENGDTLTDLSEKTGISISDIKYENYLNTDFLYIGQKIKLPYKVNEEDLYEYTRIVNTEDKSLKELADIYETDIDTINELNKDYIFFDYDKQLSYSVSSTILIPKFSKIEKHSDNYQYIKEN